MKNNYECSNDVNVVPEYNIFDNINLPFADIGSREIKRYEFWFRNKQMQVKTVWLDMLVALAIYCIVKSYAFRI